MEKSKKKPFIVTIIVFISILILFMIAVFFVIKVKGENLDDYAITEGVIVKVYDDSLLVSILEKDGKSYGLDSVKFASDGNIGFKKGQTIRIWSNGMVLETFPGYLTNVKKIKILNKDDNGYIPIAFLRYCYNSYENILVNITNISTESLSLEVNDKNEYPYEYSDEYTLFVRDDNLDKEDYSRAVYIRGRRILLEKI